MTSLRSYLPLWLPVPVFAAGGWLLATGDLRLQDGAPGLDPLFGLATLFIIAVAVGGGFVALVLAVIGSSSARARPALALSNGIWTAGLLAVFALYLGVVSYLEPAYQDSSTLGQQIPFQVAAGVLALVPLALVLWDRRRGEDQAAATAVVRQPTPTAR